MTFNLSEKRQENYEIDLEDKDDKISYYYWEQDVKEFIRLLKEKVLHNEFTDPEEDFNDIIDKLAGSKLLRKNW